MGIFCESCGYIMIEELKNNLVHETCSRCGSSDLKLDINLSDQVIIDYKEEIIGKLEREQFKKPRVEFKHGDNYFKKGRKWNRLDRVIDRENDMYYEKIVDPDTGNVIRYCKEKLSEHRGRGSAKNKRDANK